MTVWAVWQYGYDDRWVVGVFSTEEKARECIQKQAELCAKLRKVGGFYHWPDARDGDWGKAYDDEPEAFEVDTDWNVDWRAKAEKFLAEGERRPPVPGVVYVHIKVDGAAEFLPVWSYL
jgi:hypothetical protein